VFLPHVKTHGVLRNRDLPEISRPPGFLNQTDALVNGVGRYAVELENLCGNSLMLALAHAARCRPKSAGLKGRDDLLRAAGSIYKNHRYSARLERFDRASADAAAQDGVTIPQPFDKSGMTVLLGATITRSAPVFMTASVDAGLDEFHLPILNFEDEELAAASKVGGNVDSIVRRYSDLHVRFSLADTDQSKHPTASPRADSEILDDFT